MKQTVQLHSSLIAVTLNWDPQEKFNKLGLTLICKCSVNEFHPIRDHRTNGTCMNDSPHLVLYFF